MPATVQRIVVQTTRDEKKVIVAKAKKPGLPISELMRRGAAAYRPEQAEAELGALADAARAAAERAGAAIDDALAFIEASNQRIAALKQQQLKIEDLSARIIRLEAQLELLTRAALGRRLFFLPSCRALNGGRRFQDAAGLAGRAGSSILEPGARSGDARAESHHA